MPNFVVWNPANGQDEEDGKTVTASCAESAATEWAQWSDSASADYSIVGGTPSTVMVRDLADQSVTQWEVSGESVPHYRARGPAP